MFSFEYRKQRRYFPEGCGVRMYKTSNEKKIELIINQGLQPLCFEGDKAVFPSCEAIDKALFQYDLHYCFSNRKIVRCKRHGTKSTAGRVLL